ncbi:PREDICTED: E3 SUMO-protein ligase PIAS2-like isoform X2 [Priapulus caudatus]|uniref:E3 SUMO-protein ligase PIAS2-like isoform X2 n=1 Tax=Priapulus caudatus TaxID=37621 RepID=A0ABM1EL52_PRICU|nr:PREDICTED: E3 SUMO-protein ligase PIAS2-like isoform X2 [Priapulus caudatus]
MADPNLERFKHPDFSVRVDELKEMVMMFRVSELQVLLGFAGRNKTGRKTELLERALALLKFNSVPVQLKVQELYRCVTKERYPHRGNSPPVKSAPPLSTSALSSNTSTTNAHTSVSLSSAYTSSSSHTPIYNPPGSVSHLNAVPIHPDVRLRKLPFYDTLGELVRPTSLVPQGNARFQESFVIFHLTPQQAQEIAISRDIIAGARCEYTVQVQLRFCLLESTCEQDDNFPPSICVRVNTKMCPLPNIIPSNKPGVEPKRPSRPVNITGLCKLSPTSSNHISISWASEFGRAYCVAVYLVRKLNASILLQRLKNTGIRNAEHTKALIKEKFAQNSSSDCEIATTSLRVSLMCPLGKMRIQIPCRPSSCTHLQCFDASLYLQMNEKKATWICPVCDKTAAFEKLQIDGLFMEIFKKAPNSEDIKFMEDGSWQPLVQTQETLLIATPDKPEKRPAKVMNADATAPSPTKKKKESEVVIDLTLDSDSDDDNPPPQNSVHALDLSRPSSISPGLMPVPIGDPIPAYRLSDRVVFGGPPALTSNQNSRLMPLSMGEPQASRSSDLITSSVPVPVSLMRNVAAAAASSGPVDYTPSYMTQFSSPATNALYGPRYDMFTLLSEQQRSMGSLTSLSDRLLDSRTTSSTPEVVNRISPNQAGSPPEIIPLD